jgi:protein-tyrosine-phosphatase
MGETAAARNILFVCSGNIMRSVVSECVLRARTREILGETDGLMTAESCGLEAQPEMPPHEQARIALEYLGVSLCDTKASRADEDHMRRCDLAITMTRQQSYILASRFPDQIRKCFSLIELNGVIDTQLELRGTSLASRDWEGEARGLTAGELGRGLELAADILTIVPRELMRPIAGVNLYIAELLLLFSPCYHQVSGVHDPIGGSLEETQKCARLLDSEVTLLLRGLLALAICELSS